MEALLNTFIAKLLAVLIGAYFTARLAQRAAARERRRKLYGEAYETALNWKELYFRVRRRGNTDEAENELVGRFHSLHEALDFHEGWISTESIALKRSYCCLARQLKLAYEPLIQNAWKKTPLKPGAMLPKKERESLPDTAAIQERFLRDVRWHLSLFPVLPKLWIRFANRKWFSSITLLPNAYR